MRIGRTVGALALLLAMWSCAQYEQEAPLVGWTCMPTYGGCDEYGGSYTTANATVGLPFEWRLRAGCNTGQWNLASAEVNTGRLPPGLEIDPSYFQIVGVPTRLLREEGSTIPTYVRDPDDQRWLQEVAMLLQCAPGESPGPIAAGMP